MTSFNSRRLRVLLFVTLLVSLAVVTMTGVPNWDFAQTLEAQSVPTYTPDPGPTSTATVNAITITGAMPWPYPSVTPGSTMTPNATLAAITPPAGPTP